MRERRLKKELYKKRSMTHKYRGNSWEIKLSGRMTGMKKTQKVLRLGGSGRSINTAGLCKKYTVFTRLGTVGIKIRIA